MIIAPISYSLLGDESSITMKRYFDNCIATPKELSKWIYACMPKRVMYNLTNC